MNKTDILEKNKLIFDKIKLIFDKIVYGIEFIISVLLMINIFKIIVAKSYSGYFPLLNMILAVILAIALIGTIVYVIKKNKDRVEKVFLGFAIPIAIGYGIFMLPFNVPDEGTHFNKAYDLSLGNIAIKVDENKESRITILSELENYSSKRIPTYQSVLNELSKETNYNEKEQIISAAQGYSPFLYVGDVVGIIIIRALHLNIFYGLYVGRMINIIICLILGYFAIKKIPIGKIMLSIYLCMPMMMQQTASCSCDAILNAVLVFFICHLLYMVFKKDALNKRDKIELYVLTAFVAMFKYVYILLAGIVFIALITKKEERKDYIKTIAIMILIGSVFLIGWYLYSGRNTAVPEVFKEYYKITNINPEQQVEFIKSNPMKAVIIFFGEYVRYGIDYIYGAVGSQLGWLDINVNQLIIFTYLLILVIATISEKSEFELSTISKVWILAIIFAISALVNITMLIDWTPVGMNRICGVQGRYFTPILLLPLLCLIKKDSNWKVNNLNQKMIIISSVLNICTLIQVVYNYIW